MKDARLDIGKLMTNYERLQKFFNGEKQVGETKGENVTFAKYVTETAVDKGHHKVLGLDWDFSFR